MNRTLVFWFAQGDSFLQKGSIGLLALRLGDGTRPRQLEKGEVKWNAEA